ncbi:MAG: hypothetical protein MH204_01490, partial [Fimbriimonadaceae bacterium]|nr:hypothetical protein [Fimbriimonadaceae bacterium]
GYRVETTLHADVQRESEAQLLRTIRSYRSVRTGAAVVLDRDGRIVSMIGGPDYSESQFNSAVDGRRQPGSSFKPFVYATALKRGLIGGAGSLVSNRRVTVRENGRTRTIKSGGPAGSVSMEQAMAYSYNSAAWNTMRMAGPANVVNVSRTDFGMTGLLPAVPSLALGTAELSPLEMAAAYSVFQRAGERVEPFAIERVLGPTGLPIYVADPKSIRTGISATMAGAIDQSLQAVVEYGTGKRASGVKNARGKTGTTNDNRDAWFCGYTNDYVGVVWVANPITRADGRRVYSPMTVMGGEVAAPAWGRIMRGVQAILGERSPKSDYGAASRRTRRVRDTSDETDAPGRAEREADNAPVSAGDEGRDGTQAGAQAPALTEEPTRQPAAETRPDPPRNDPPPVRPPQEPAPAAEPEEVLVTVCVDSGQRATGYCPETVRRRFPRGQEPKGRCPIHRP